MARQSRPPPRFDPWPAEFAQLDAICGIDEVGRGPLAGPVVAAAVILPRAFPTGMLADSKALKPAAREEISRELQRHLLYSLSYNSHEIIDRINIRQATLLAMRRAVFALHCLPDAALIDGRDVPPGLHCPACAIIQGDARQAAIAAASILAKVARDRLMVEAARLYPGYGFDEHMGYPTPDHLAAIRRLGLSPIHRRSFGPCRTLTGEAS